MGAQIHKIQSPQAPDEAYRARVDALDRALCHHERYSQATTRQILDTAKDFEKFLKGENK